jgi:hypothetical protein
MKIQNGRHMLKQEDNIKIIIREIVCKDVNNLRIRVQLWVFVNTVMNLRELNTCSRKILYHGVIITVIATTSTTSEGTQLHENISESSFRGEA